MDKLTEKEKAWIEEVNAVLARCPSKRLAFYTIGDPEVVCCDKRHLQTADDTDDDLVCVLNRSDGHMEGATLYFPAAINGVCG